MISIKERELTKKFSNYTNAELKEELINYQCMLRRAINENSRLQRILTDFTPYIPSEEFDKIVLEANKKYVEGYK